MVSAPLAICYQFFKSTSNWRFVEAVVKGRTFWLGFMVCFHCPIPIPTPIPIPIPMKLGSMIMCRTVSTEPTLIPIVIPIPIPMATVPNLAQILVPIRWNLSSFHSNCP